MRRVVRDGVIVLVPEELLTPEELDVVVGDPPEVVVLDPPGLELR